MGCRVVVEAALQAPAQPAAVVLIDGSQFSMAMEAVLQQRFAKPNGYAALVHSMFQDMFTAHSEKSIAASVIERAGRLPRTIGEKMLTDMQRYDVALLAASLASLRAPVLVVQSTYSNEKRERRSMQQGQPTPYLDMILTSVPSARVEIIADTGHFPQLDATVRTNALIESFLAALPPQPA